MEQEEKQQRVLTEEREREAMALLAREAMEQKKKEADLMNPPKEQEMGEGQEAHQ